MRPLMLVLASTLLVGPAVAETLPAGVVACLSEKYARSYAGFAEKAPDFAADLISRAACYVNKEPVEVVSLSSSKGFQQYQLLSGHKVWVAAAQRPNK